MQGSTIQERVFTRINTWGVGKWSCLSTNKQQRLAAAAAAFALLRKACAEREEDIPKFARRHLRNICRSWPAAAGLGLDLWVIRLLGTLPDHGLRVLLSILTLALRGKIPMQIFWCLLGSLAKPMVGKCPSPSLPCCTGWP